MSVRTLFSIGGLVAVTACADGASKFTRPTGFDGSIAGVVTRYPDGAPVAGATVSFSSASVRTRSDGSFVLPGTPGAGSVSLSVSALDYLDRAITVTAGTGPVSIDLIENELPFQYEFYKWFARNGLSDPGQLRSLARWTVNPSFYVKVTLEDVSETVPPHLVTEIARVFEASVPELSGGRFQVDRIEVGTEARDPRRPGWVDVTFYREHPNSATTRGSATVGGNTGRMLLRYNPERDDTPELLDSHSCASLVVYVAEHEITHTMGFWHAGSEGDFNSSVLDCAGTGRLPRARHHAALVYSRPPGNRDPDLDPFLSLPLTARGDGRGNPMVACTWADVTGQRPNSPG